MRISHIQVFSVFSNLTVHRKIYLIGLIVLVVGLPLSSVLVSSAQFLLGLNWIIEGNFKNKWLQLKQNSTIWIFALLPLIHLLWLINTTDFTYALHDLKIKVPLLLLPFIIGTTPILSAKELKIVLYAFVFAVFSGTVVSLAILAGIYSVNGTEVKTISIFISHIRFGLMIVLSLIVIGYYTLRTYKSISNIKKVFIFGLVVWLLVFLVLLQSITGWVVISVIGFITVVKYYKAIPSIVLRNLVWIALLAFVIFSTVLIFNVYHNFYQTKTYDLTQLPDTTPRGNKYINDTIMRTKENGHYVHVLVCYKELALAWPTRSKIQFQGKDANGYPIWGTLVRYLASKGLPKDYDGVMALDDKDIELIEQGYASCVYRERFFLYIKIYNVIWEIDRYLKTGDANSKSIVQRIEFNKAALHIIHKNFWWGVGTGDLAQSYKMAYQQIDTNLHPKNQLRAHNQLVTFWVSFGLIGLTIALVSIFFPLIKHSKNNYLLLTFVIAMLISMLNEDTLETQAGVTFYIFFYALFVFSKQE